MINKKWKIVSAIVIFGICIGLYIWGSYRTNKLLTNHTLVNGAYIYECHYGGRGNAGRLFIGYTFLINGNRTNGSSSYQTSQLYVQDCEQYFVGHTFPIIYQSDNPMNNIILITPDVFKRYNYNFPDSLQWVLKYLKADK